MTDRSIQNSNNLDTQPFISAPQIQEGRVLANRFRVVKSLGNGAQADVYLTIDELLETEIAIKVVESKVHDPRILNALRNEVLIARKLQHPNIIRIFDVYEDNGLVFFTMEYIKGEPLFQRLTQSISQSQYQNWGLQLFAALIACQDAGVKHGDIKPDNILIDANDQLRLIDFGIGQHDSEESQTSGHKDYSAPEVIHSGRSSTQSDIFSAGKVLNLILSAVESDDNSNKFTKWRRKQEKFIARLIHPQPQSRPALHQAITILAEESTSNSNNKATKLALLATFIVASIILLTWLWPSKLSLPDKVIQLAVVNDNNSELLDNLTQLLVLPLQSEPALALSSVYQTQQLIENLSLQPSNVANDRVELAVILGLDAMIVLSVANIDSDDFLVRASVTIQPENLPLFESTQSVNANSLQNDLAVFSKSIRTQLASYSERKISAQNEQSTRAGKLYLAAEKAYNNFDIESTRSNLDSLFNLPSDNQYWRLKGRLLQAELNEDLALAQQSIDKLLELFPDRSDLLAKRADIYQWADKNDLAIIDYQSALQINPNNGQLWFELGKLKIITGDTQSAIENELTRALVSFRKNKDKAGESLVLNAFGVAHLRLSEYDTAQRYFKDSLEIRDAQNFPLERANTLANFANAAAINGQFQVAKNSLEEASILLKQEGNLAEQAHIFDTLGFLHEEQGLYYEALNYYKSGLDLRVSQSSAIEQAESMSNVAYMHFLTGEFSLADIYWQQANALFGKSSDFSHQLRTWQNLAQLSLAKGDDITARRYLQQVSEKLDPSQQQELMINNILYSYYHFANANLSAAMDKIKQAKQIAQLTDDSRALTEIYLWHGEMCLKIVDIKCLQEQIGYAEAIIPKDMIERHVVLVWLQFGLNSLSSDFSLTEPKYLLDQLQQISLPVMTEMKILLDIQERLQLPNNSAIMLRLNEMVKPIFYQQFMNWLYIQARDGEKRSSLEQQAISHPNFWRNHLYYTQIAGESAQRKQQKLQEEWLSKLSEEQAQAYRERYLE